MRWILYCNILDVCWNNIPDGKSTVMMKSSTILQQLKKHKLDDYQNLTISDVEKVLRVLFPIYKNRRRRTQIFKINLRSIEKALKRYNLVLDLFKKT